MTADELRRAQTHFEQLDHERELARLKRNILVAQALAEGWTHEQVGTATRLTRGRIGQLAPTAGTSTSRRNEDTPPTSTRGR